MAVIVVVGADTHLGGRIVDRLVARGRSVVALTRPHSRGNRSRPPAPVASGVTPAPGSSGGDRPFGSPGAASSAAVAVGEMAEVAVEGDGPGAVVAAIAAGAAGRPVAAVLHAEVDEASCIESPLTSMTPDDWHDLCARPVASALWTARAAFDVLGGGGGTLAFVCPSVAMTGAAGLVPLATAGEAVRLLAKSAARRWGGAGITVNVFAPSVDACSPHDRGAGRPAVNAAAFDESDVDAADEIASLLAYLADPGSARLSGATLGTDGGELMAP